MTRGLFYFLIALCGIAALLYWGVPAVMQTFIGQSLLVRVNVTQAFEDPEVELKNGELVSRTIVGLEILFPMGGAPENVGELTVHDDEGRVVDINWGSRIEREDLPDQKITRWVIKEAFFPSGFRHGMLCNKVKDLVYLKLHPFPLNP